MIDGYDESPASFPVSTNNHCIGSTLNPYLMKFSSSSRNPPIVRRRKPQLTRPEKLLKFELHEKSESRGLWILDGATQKKGWIELMKNCTLEINKFKIAGQKNKSQKMREKTHQMLKPARYKLYKKSKNQSWSLLQFTSSKTTRVTQHFNQFGNVE